ncbi:uncharacterized protein LOC18427163 [Amborella trichopoda]|uniref:uncharacterized protein LOC18427163 n=1 Tax=Amborella trichopoda TaxID=13333 RepID=UPI0005D2F1F0|nr:uncharacterized protein LOC18427163 [Amborella trichopoda]|eukprot:XP_011620758.1 uncharacterized protein LOC18427163 [Amborella trichopoda]
MDWNLINNSDDHIVPVDRQKASEMICNDHKVPSPDAWLQQGVNKRIKRCSSNWISTSFSEPWGSENKTPNLDMESLYSELYGESISNQEGSSHTEDESLLSYLDDEDFSKTSQLKLNEDPPIHGIYGNLSWVNYKVGKFGDLPENELSDEGSDYQLENQWEDDQPPRRMPQIGSSSFINPSLEVDLPGIETFLQSPEQLNGPECSLRAYEKLLEEMFIDPLSFVKESSSTDISNHLKTSDAPSAADLRSSDWEEDSKQEACSHGLAGCYEREEGPLIVKGPVFTSVTHTGMNEFHMEQPKLEEEESSAELVLQELEAVITQLNPNARIFFRDALYRMVAISKQQISRKEGTNTKPIMDRSCPSLTCTGSSRNGTSRWMESQTNRFDRFIANLLFNSRN